MVVTTTLYMNERHWYDISDENGGPESERGLPPPPPRCYPAEHPPQEEEEWGGPTEYCYNHRNEEVVGVPQNRGTFTTADVTIATTNRAAVAADHTTCGGGGGTIMIETAHLHHHHQQHHQQQLQHQHHHPRQQPLYPAASLLTTTTPSSSSSSSSSIEVLSTLLPPPDEEVVSAASPSSSPEPPLPRAIATTMRPFSNHKNKTMKATTVVAMTTTTTIPPPPRRSLPPRPPPTTTTTTYIEKTDFPVVQNSTDDDLSFADFSGSDDDDDDDNNDKNHHDEEDVVNSSGGGYFNDAYFDTTHHQHPPHANGAGPKSNTSLSGFLEDGAHGHSPQHGGDHYSYAHHNNNHYRKSSQYPPPQQQHHYHHTAGPSPRLSLRRRNKVCAVDVASVGNASDTLISVHDHPTHHPGDGGAPHPTADAHRRADRSASHHHHVRGRELHETAKIAFNAGQYSQALPLFETILASQARRFTAYHPSVGAALHNVGVCRQRMGENTIAEGLFRQAVEIRERTLGFDHLEVAASLSKLGAALTALTRYDEAIECLRRALKICRTAPTPMPVPTTTTTGTTTTSTNSSSSSSSSIGNAKTTAQMLCHLACLYFEAGELMASEATFHDALDLYRQVYQDSSSNTNTTSNNGIGSSGSSICSNHSSGTTTSSNNNNASVMLQLADTLCNVGSIQNRRKRFAKSVESFTEALDLQMKIIVHPETDPRVISTLDNLGYSYSKLKDYASAEKCYRKMFRGQVSAAASASNNNHSSSNHTKNNSSSNGGGNNNTSAAASSSFSTAAFETFRKLLLVLEKLRKYGQAVEETKDALQLAKGLLPRDHTIIVQLKDIMEDLKKQQQQEPSNHHYNTSNGGR